MNNILITGGTGLLGKQLTDALIIQGHNVSHLSRRAGNNAVVKTFLWDIAKGTIDPECINGIDTIVHLAGEGIAEKRWTTERKKLLIESRTKSIGLIYKLLKSTPHTVKHIVSASATGYYSDRGNELLTETSPPAHDFLSDCCVQWEKAVDEGEALGLRVVKFRTGVVLSPAGGALPLMAKPVQFFVGSPLGSGKQWIPWIHHRDVVAMYLLGITNEKLTGVYNMVAPNPVTNAQLTKAIAKQLHRPLWAPRVPAFALKLLLGEMSLVVLGSTKVSSGKIEQTGFKFSYPDVESALKELYGG
ncbi:TIGR01777 family oxidoreductase [Mucilaginibacter sp. HMF5004]|uniref:TIGR01777 family oxidoreductase n=1 Tax=Mucilaginibacter rivuli TaxID=2857527 RepID=UPI001C5F7DA2|nr:TIGR01777 family oxidoreductase [Mucilaginibacter rivuli]MBW4888375.1 TIGR01777 family oxidoreductase [Mucilaginibacter rivuli]